MNTAQEQPTLASRFGKYSPTHIKKAVTDNVVVYTRVSTKEQADKNLSLETQKKTIEEYALRHNLKIIEYFGGTYESAKTDGRKEFKRMLEFIRKCKGQVSQVLVYTLDRFSRTGGAAIKVASDLRDKYGVSVFAVTQPTDTTNPSGILHQNIQLLFSEFDNQQRRQRVIAGMTEKFKQGYWVVKPPQGYDIITKNGVRNMVLNEEGRKMHKAFEWKAQGMKNEEIIVRLQKMGVEMYKQKLHKIFKNPFYCGLIAHGMLNGKVVEGKHEPMISKELFMKVNSIITDSPLYGTPHKRENTQLPLRVFVRCSECGEPFTGYIMKQRNIYYYKCRTKGCRCNRNAKQLNDMFLKLLEHYRLTSTHLKPFIYHMSHAMNDALVAQEETEKNLRLQLAEVVKKVDTIEEKYYVLNQMEEQTFEKFHNKYRAEKEQLLLDLAKTTNPISNNKEVTNILTKAAEIASEVPDIWAKGGADKKEALQKLVFPEGIIYDRQKGTFRTPAVNPVFEIIPRLIKELEDNEKGTIPFLKGKSLSAEREGFEPPEPAKVQRFSRPPQSTTLPSLQKVWQIYYTL